MEKDCSIDDPNRAPYNWEYHYSLLGAQGRKDPIKSLIMLTNIDSLFDVRRDLWELLLSTMYSSHNEDNTPEDKGDLVFFFQCIHELWELAYRVGQLVETKKLIYSYHFNDGEV